jgi:hypothetical protein
MVSASIHTDWQWQTYIKTYHENPWDEWRSNLGYEPLMHFHRQDIVTWKESQVFAQTLFSIHHDPLRGRDANLPECEMQLGSSASGWVQIHFNGLQHFGGWNSQPFTLCACIRAKAVSLQFYHWNLLHICVLKMLCKQYNTTLVDLLLSLHVRALQTKTKLGSEPGCRSYRSLAAICNYVINWTHKTVWRTNLWNRFQAAEKYVRKCLKRHQKTMPTAIEISDDSDEVTILSWSLPSLSLWFFELFCITIPCSFFLNLCTIPREMRRVALMDLMGMQGAGHESESEFFYWDLLGHFEPYNFMSS